MRADSVARDFSIRDYSQERIGGVVAELAAIVRIGRRACWVIAQDVGQQRLCHSRRLLPGKPAGMFQRVCEDGDETGVVLRLCRTIGLVLIAGEERSL